MHADLDRDGQVGNSDYSLTSGSTSAVPGIFISHPDIDNIVGYNGYIYNQETGYYTVRYRDYDPTNGRFLQRDPLGYADGSNLYEYVASSPLVWTDPMGLETQDWYAEPGSSNPDFPIYDPYIERPGVGEFLYVFVVEPAADVAPEFVEPVHYGLDGIGLIPGAGEVADGLNGVIYTIEGREVEAGLSFGGMVPVAGWGCTLGKWGLKAVKETAEHADEALDAAKHVDEIVETASDVPSAKTTAKASDCDGTPTPLTNKEAADLLESNNAKFQNKKLAGKNHPETGIPYDKDGFPDFSGVQIGDDVQIKMTGNRAKDSKAANKAAGYDETPPGCTWHHHQDGTTMQLVPRDIHDKTAHTGGKKINDLRTGDG